jgi:hypothetical protein
MKRYTLSSSLGTLALLIFWNVACVAQQVGYTETTAIDLSLMGPLGSLLDKGMQTEVSIDLDSGVKREDTGKNAVTLSRVQDQDIVTMNTKKETYTRITFGDLGEMVESQAGALEAQADEEAESMDTDFKLDVVSTGSQKVIDGRLAEEEVVIIETTASNSETGEPIGKIFVVISHWGVELDEEIEVARQWEKQMFEAFGGEMKNTSMGEALSSAFANDPETKEAFERAGEKLEGLSDRYPVAQTTYIVKTPLDAELDLEKVLAAAPAETPTEGKKKRRLGRRLRKLVDDTAAAQEAAEQDESGTVNSQVTVMSMTVKKTDIRFIDRDSDDYGIPSTYREVDYQGNPLTSP